MCAIAGFVTYVPFEDKRSRVEKMLTLLAHRGPDDEGLWEDDTVCLGHKRLAILDLSSAGHQPMGDRYGNVLVYNGEIYNFKELRDDLQNLGVHFHSRSDTEVLLHGYRIWGEEIIYKIKGFFAFAIWDAKRRILFCGRDPFGKKPFYYFWRNQQFIFASEIEALVAGLNFRPEPDSQGIAHYLLKGYFTPGRSVYKSIDMLKAGCSLRLDLKKGTLRQSPYWQPRFQLGRFSLRDFYKVTTRCEQLIGEAVRRRFQSDVPVGVLLSGGVDSSLIALISRTISKSNYDIYGYI
jgi:asparagine synthase (glutamine-hydrolysing)